MKKLFIDTETCGLAGMPITIQYAWDDGPVLIHEIWTQPAYATIELIESFLEAAVIGFNISFDWFMLCKIYTTFLLLEDKNVYPEDYVHEIAILEEQARFTDVCLKPAAACDLMLLARKGPLQSLMSRDPVRIRRVPTALAWHLADELEKRVKFDPIYFAKNKKREMSRWKIYDVKRDRVVNKDFKDVVLKFNASGALKNLYRHAFGITEKITVFSDIEVDRKFWPFEFKFAPYALAVCPHFLETRDWTTVIRHGGHKKRVTAWPGVIKEHIFHWGEWNVAARKYASDDVEYTRRLYKEYFKSPEPGDNDSTLACMVAACRWRGYAINISEIKKLKAEAESRIGKIPIAPKQAKWYIEQGMDDTERAVSSTLGGSTKKVVLEEMVKKWKNDDGTMHPAAVRAKQVLDARKARKEIELYDKLLIAKRFHASFVIIGALSSRMSGSDDLNPQGINHAKTVRAAFTLADGEHDMLCGGDFKGFEVAIALRVFDDPKLNALVCSGKKVHALMGMKLFPGKTYEEVIASDGVGDPDMYDIGKKGFFLTVYFGNAYTYHTKLGIDMDIAEEAEVGFHKDFTSGEVKRFQDEVKHRFTALSQPNGIGSKVEWKEPAKYSETLLNFRRYFDLEIKTMRALFEIAQNPPKEWRNVQVKVQRRDRIQTAGGAVASALYAAAFALNAAIIRAAGNNYIQSVGAEITKGTQRAIWDLQPVGVHPFIVRPMNIHDEIMVPTRRGYEYAVKDRVLETVNEYKKIVDLLAIDWFTDIANWSEKKGRDSTVPRSPQEEASRSSQSRAPHQVSGIREPVLLS